MCITTKLQQNIISFTKDGEHVARFLTETMQGRHTDAKFNHRLEAAKHLIKYGFTDTQCDNIPLSLRMRAQKPLPPRWGKVGMGVKYPFVMSL